MSSVAATELLLTDVDGRQHVASPTVVLSFGLGLDSSALLLRWLEEPGSRDFDLSELVVVTAHTGDEFDSTRRSVERHVLPRLREQRVRTIQCARSRRITTTAGGGVVVLDDSTQPRRLFSGGSYKLSQEMVSQGTIPQLGGARLCSVHAKGSCLDPVIATVTAGQPFRHALGFEVGEQRRATKDTLYNSAQRVGWYPLIEWGWSREDCQRYVTQLVGEPILKSACGFCPFAASTQAGRQALMGRYRDEPGVGARALFIEDVAQRLNPRQTLVAGRSLAQVVQAAGLTAVTEALREMYIGVEFAVYEVRRVTPVTKSGRRGFTARSVRAVACGSREDMEAHLAGLGGRRITGEDGIVRHHVDAAEECEHLLVVAPHVVENKERKQFPMLWQEAHNDRLF